MPLRRPLTAFVAATLVFAMLAGAPVAAHAEEPAFVVNPAGTSTR
ncbi:hypothetical protein I552_6816 [Mycobacterium xenopi 3993]|nr:hypothetical protein I552_6816 [Mycobacterium xenopi 3993]